MKQYYIEVITPPFPIESKKFKVWSTYPGDALSPNLTMLFSVWAFGKEDAISKCLCGEASTLLSPNAKKLELV